jgi:hypothetical protein
MIYSLLKRAVLLIVLVCIPLVHSTCSSQSTPTLLEVPVPVTLKFISPDRLKINFGTIERAAAGSVSVQKVVGEGEFSEAVAFGPETLELVESTGMDFLRGIEEVEIDVDPTITFFEDDIEFSDASDLLSGLHNVKILFGPFDFDNDGVLEPCLNDITQPPVCAFIWLDNEQLAAWVIEEYSFDDDPTTTENEETIGKGKFKVFAESVTAQDPQGTVPDREVGSTAFTVFYEQDSEDEKTVEHFLKADIASGPFFSGGSQEDGNPFNVESHIKIAESLLNSSALKRIDAVTKLEVPAESFVIEAQYLGQFLEGVDLWSGSFDGEFFTSEGTEPVQFANQCVRISTGELSEDPNACADRGFSVGDDPFIRAFLPSDVAVPNDFQEFAPF